MIQEGGGGGGGNLSGDPTSGGDPSNSGESVCYTVATCPSGAVIGQQQGECDPTYCTQVTTTDPGNPASNPEVQTEAAPLPDTLSFADQQLQAIAPGIVRGAGSIGDLSTIGLFYGASFLGGAGLEMAGAFEAPEALTLGDTAETPVTWLTDATQPGSQYANFNATTTASDAQATLSANGYSVTGTTSSGGPVMSNGTNYYSFYTRASTEAEGMMFKGGGNVIKYNLVGP